MKWTKLKQLIEERIAPSLSGRVAINQARYRHSLEELGRIWITVDGAEIAEFSTTGGQAARHELADELRNLTGMKNPSVPGQAQGYYEADEKARQLNRQAGLLSDEEAQRQLEEYLNLPVDAALGSDSPLIRALAFLDGRLGKRRLKLDPADEPRHPLVRQAWLLRCGAEGLIPERDTAV